MDLSNNDKIKSFKAPTHNTQTQPLPPHSDPAEGFMGADTGVNGRMGDYAKGVTNTE